MPLKDFVHSLIVLSYGRTGSVLLVSNLKNGLVGKEPAESDHIKYVDQLPYDFSVDQQTVFHCHLMLDRSLIPGLHRVFSIRLNPIDQICSFIMARQFKQLHLGRDWAAPALEPFVFSDWDFLDRACHLCKQWHQYYASQLQPDDFVIVYERMVRMLKPGQSWSKIYPDKHQIILNHMEVVDRIVSKFNWQSEIETFSTHQNSIDLYQYITE